MVRNQSGFSLTELMVTLFLFSILSGGVVLTMNTGEQSWYVNQTRNEMQQELRRAAEWIKNELRHASSSSIVDVPNDGGWYTQITFKVPTGVTNGNKTWGTDILYSVIGGILIRTQDSTTRVIANDIVSVMFRRDPGENDIVEVFVFGSKDAPKRETLNDSVYFNVTLRNG